MERISKYVKKNDKQKSLCQRLRYKFSKHDKIDQAENVFAFGFETYNDKEFGEAYAAGLYDVNRLRDRWCWE